MPYPVLLAVGAAAAAAGTGMSIAGNEQSKAAMNSALQAERTRQRGYQQEASATLKQSMDQSGRDTADRQLAEGEAARLKAYAEAQKAPLQGLPTVRTGNTVVNSPAADARARSTASANAWSRLTNKTAAKVGGYEDWGLNQDIKNARANQSLAVTSNLARGSTSILPMEMEAASHEGDALAGWGQLVSALGLVAGAAGSVGTGAASAAPEAGAWAPAAIEPLPVGGAGAGFGASNPSAWSMLSTFMPR